MNGTKFALASYEAALGGPFAAIVLGDKAVALNRVYPAYRDSARGKAGPLTATDGIQAMLEGWDHNFPVLQEIVAFIEDEGLESDRIEGAVAEVAGLRPLPPVAAPGKILNAAQNFQEHVDEMVRAGNSPKGGRTFTGEKSTSWPYLFLKAPSVLAGAHDNIEIPRAMSVLLEVA